MAHDVVRERHVLDDRPWCAAILVTHRKHNGETGLRIGPVMLEDVSIDKDTLCILELKDVLYRP